ncbi:MAG: hypothetical protein EBT15_09780 [Betaproteobacteria bacterium]|nr:hypothetical protein [Betaproteobacteria bacterium]
MSKMSGYYPDGVTGNEYAIAGADREWDDERTVACQNEDCAEFEVDTDLEVALSSYGSSEWGSFTCPACGTQGEYEGEVNDEPDPDRYRD